MELIQESDSEGEEDAAEASTAVGQEAISGSARVFDPGG